MPLDNRPLSTDSLSFSTTTMNMSTSITADEDWLIILSSSDIDDEPQNPVVEKTDSDYDARPDMAPADSVNTLTAKEKTGAGDVAETDFSDSQHGSVVEIRHHEAAPEDLTLGVDSSESVQGPDPTELNRGDIAYSEQEKDLDNLLQNSLEKPFLADDAVSKEASLDETTPETATTEEKAQIDTPTLKHPKEQDSGCNKGFACFLLRSLNQLDSSIRNASRLIYRALFADLYSSLDAKRRDLLFDFTLFQHARYLVLSALNHHQDFLIYYAFAFTVSVVSVAALRPAPQPKELTVSEKLTNFWTQLAYEEVPQEKRLFFFAKEETPRQLRVSKLWNRAVDSTPKVWSQGAEATKRVWTNSFDFSKKLWSGFQERPETQNVKAAFAEAYKRTLTFSKEEFVPLVRQSWSEGKQASNAFSADAKVKLHGFYGLAKTSLKAFVEESDQRTHAVDQKLKQWWGIACQEAPVMKARLDQTSRDLYKWSFRQIKAVQADFQRYKADMEEMQRQHPIHGH